MLSKEQTDTGSKTALVNSLSRGLWDTRREIAAAREREASIQKELFALTRSRPEPFLEVEDTEADKERSMCYIHLLYEFHLLTTISRVALGCRVQSESSPR